MYMNCEFVLNKLNLNKIMINIRLNKENACLKRHMQMLNSRQDKINEDIRLHTKK